MVGWAVSLDRGRRFSSRLRPYAREVPPGTTADVHGHRKHMFDTLRRSVAMLPTGRCAGALTNETAEALLEGGRRRPHGGRPVPGRCGQAAPDPRRPRPVATRPHVTAQRWAGISSARPGDGYSPSASHRTWRPELQNAVCSSRTTDPAHAAVRSAWRRARSPQSSSSRRPSPSALKETGARYPQSCTNLCQ